jgi:hypothetical protein
MKEDLKEFSTMENPSDTMIIWSFEIAKEERLEELHNCLLDIDLKEVSTDFLVGMMMALNWNTSEMEIGILCSVNKKTNTRWIRNDFAERAYSVMKSRDSSDQLLGVFRKD